MNSEWISVQEQAPPIGKEVAVKYFASDIGKEIKHVDKLIHMLNNTYIWAYSDYNDCENMCWKLLD